MRKYTITGQSLAGVLFGIVAWMLALRVIARGGKPEGTGQDLFGLVTDIIRIVQLVHLLAALLVLFGVFFRFVDLALLFIIA